MNHTTPDFTTHWPYPRWIAHRGAGKQAPENTLAAFRLGAAQGYRMFECDVKLSRDGVPFLLHDSTLERTTNGSGTAGDRPWADLAQLDAGSWHSRQYRGEPLPTLAAVAHYCQAHGLMVNLEIKPTPGREYETGEVVAHLAMQLWHGHTVPPLLSSFQVEALRGARAAAPALPRALLLDKLGNGWLDAALELGCVAVVLQHRLWDALRIALVRAAGLRSLSYTVNEADTAERLWTLGLDGLITDRTDFFAPG